MFTQNEARRPPAQGRMQNGKLDLGRNDPSWFGGGGGAMRSGDTTTALQAQSRTTPSFASAIGGQQHRPLDPSEFPSLGGNPQSQQSPSSFAPNVSSWGSNNLRQRSPERQPFIGIGRGRGRVQDEAPPSNFAPGAEGYRFGGGQTNSPAARAGRAPTSPFPTQDQEPVGYLGQSSTSDPPPNTDGPSSPQTVDSTSGSKHLSEMNDNERYGMAGLAARLNANGPDYNPLLNGFDLSKLGINLDSSEPLINTWGGPFDEQNLVIPEFTLPPAYTVSNVPPLASKMESFSDETLIMIFHQHAADQLQELAAQALYKRDWRWHKTMHMWMMKDTQYGISPIKLSEKTERGMYIFFDINNWRRERKEILLNYEDLDTRWSLLAGANANVGAAGGANGQTAGQGVALPGQQGGFAGMGGGSMGGGAFGGGLGAV